MTVNPTSHSIHPSSQNNYRIAIVVSTFYKQIADALLNAATQRLTEYGIPDKNVDIAFVPGAVEIPLIAQEFAKLTTYDAIICLGTVIQGETDHYQYVCQQVSQGCQHVALNYALPVIFGILTTQNEAQALQRASSHPSGQNKGRVCVDIAMNMIQNVLSIRKGRLLSKSDTHEPGSTRKS